jgi:hypothetical protein
MRSPQHSSRGGAAAMLEPKLYRINNLRLIPRRDVVALVANEGRFYCHIVPKCFSRDRRPMLPATSAARLRPPVLVPRSLSIRARALLLPFAPRCSPDTRSRNGGGRRPDRPSSQERVASGTNVPVWSRSPLDESSFSCFFMPFCRGTVNSTGGQAESSARVGRRGSNRGP